MNVLILTPDRVGSTLLQRLITIYMLRKGFDKPVINLHELTNGLEKYYNELFNQEVLGKPRGTSWGYFQKLDAIEEILKSVDHYKTSRLAHYHIIARQDTISEQLKFYEYLNNNFFIIGCRRENLFEHAISWVISDHSKHLNVYSAEQKVNVFSNLQNNGITVAKESFYKHLNDYKKYIDWSDHFFNVQSYFNYDTDVHRIEDYILSLDFMCDATNSKWEDMFGQTFKEWNSCHRMLPNLILENKLYGLDVSLPASLLTDYNNPRDKWDVIRGDTWPKIEYDYILNKDQNLPEHIKIEIDKFIRPTSIKVNNDEYKFLEKNLQSYHKSFKEISNLVTNGILVTGVPIKLHSLREKKQIIKNYTQCVEWYNEWVSISKFSHRYQSEELEQIMVKEDAELTLPIYSQTQLQ